jgi:hypothetical protein
MTQTTKSAVAASAIVALGGIVLLARGQSTTRPGEPTLARVWVENRAPSDALPVIVESVATPVTTHLDTTSTVQTVTGRQMWDYRTVALSNAANGSSLGAVGMEGWEAVGVVQSGPTGATILFKRPR